MPKYVEAPLPYLVVLAVKRADPVIPSSITTEHLFRRGRSTCRITSLMVSMPIHSDICTYIHNSVRYPTTDSPLGT